MDELIHKKGREGKEEYMTLLTTSLQRADFSTTTFLLPSFLPSKQQRIRMCNIQNERIRENHAT